MIEGCNALGAIVTCGGAGLLVGVSIGAWVWARKPASPFTKRHRDDAARKLDQALDDLAGIPTPDDIRRARLTIGYVAGMIETPV